MTSYDSENNDPELTIIREFLDSATLDASGYIDETELAAVVDLSSEEIKQIFQKLDTDHDGRISIEQFTEYYKEQQQNDATSKIPNHKKQIRHDNLTKESIRDSGYSMSEPSHRKNRPHVNNATKRKASKHLNQEYLDDLYEVARSRDDPLLLESLENFLAATVDNLLQKQADNERLDAALKHAKEQNSEIAAQIEEEMEEQANVLEQKIRSEEQEKLEQQKHEAHAQLLKAASELSEMEHKVIALEDRLKEQKLKENAIPDQFIEKIQRKEQENQQLQNKLLEFQTQMALMRTEVAAMKSEYDEQASRLNNERGTVLSCIREQENLTRQLQMLHEANKRLHDTNDDLRSALDVKRSSSLMSEGPSPVKRSQSCVYQSSPYKHYSELQSSFRSDPGFMKYHSTLNNTDFNDTDEDSRQSFPHDDDDKFINRQSLMTELMNADDQYEPPLETSRPTSLLPSLQGDSVSQQSEREQFAMQLELLAETNRRLGESNDELRHALSLLSDQARSDRGSDILSMRESPPGCYSAPTTPLRSDYTEHARPNSTSSPRKVKLTKSGYHSMSMYTHSQTDEEIDEDDMDDEELIRLVDQTTNDTASMTDEPITVEEKILIEEPRGFAVGADTSSESTLSGNVSGEPEEMFKLVLAGNAAVGKSSFIIRLCKNKFYSALNSTLGVDFQMKRLNVDKRQIALQLWDTAGQERFRSIAKSYFRRVDGVILLYDVTCESSFLDVRDWIESIESSASERVPIILCGNKVDLRPEAMRVGMPVISREQGKALANEVGALFVETSAKEGTNIHKTCKDLVRMMQAKEKPKENGAFPLDSNNNADKKNKAGCCRS